MTERSLGRSRFVAFGAAVLLVAVCRAEASLGTLSAETCVNPWAVLGEFSVIDQHATWMLEAEMNAASYDLEAALDQFGPWSRVGGGPWPSGQWNYSATVGSGTGPWYRVVEQDSAGVKTVLGYARSEPTTTIPSVIDPPTVGELQARVDSLFVQLLAGDPLPSNGEQLVVYCPLSFEVALGAYKDYWSDQGYTVEIQRLEDLPGPPGTESELRLAVDQDIEGRAAGGVKYFHLVGDASDSSAFSQPWPGAWADVKNAKIARGDSPTGNGEYNIIPTWYRFDWAEGGLAMGGGYPYYSSDQPYADVDGDEVPDVVVARWPARSVYDVWALVAKFGNHKLGLLGGYERGLALACDDLTYGAEDRVVEQIDQIASELGNASVIFTSTQGGGVERTAVAASVWSSFRPEIVVLHGANSSRYFPARFLLKSDYFEFEPSMLSASWAPLVVGLSCGIGDFAGNERYGYLTPVGQDLILHDVEGAIALTGPSMGTWLEGNLAIGDVLVAEALADPDRSMAEAWLAGVRAVSLDSGTTLASRETVWSYSFLGDPLSRLRGSSSGAPTGSPVVGTGSVANLSIRAEGSPGWPVRFAVHNPRRQPVTLRIYDVTGRYVGVAHDGVLDAGTSTFRWPGGGEQGVASGVYFGIVDAGGERRVRKVVVVR